MRSRLPSWILLLYLAIDLANPFLPGAFQFTSEGGLVWVEGTSQPRMDAGAGASEASGHVASPRGKAFDGSLLIPGVARRTGYLTAWLVRVRTGDPPAQDFPPSDSDDH
jgi:hypothetical protein